MIERALPGPRSNTQIEPTSPLGIALRKARLEKQIPQRVIGEALAAKCGGSADNVRVSGFELSRKLPTDAELTVIAQVLGLSVATLRQKREASHEHRQAIAIAMYERQIERGQKKRARKFKHRAMAQVPGPVAPKPAPKAIKPASVPALAELVEQIDEIAPMPVDRDKRKRWFQCVGELSRIGAAS